MRRYLIWTLRAAALATIAILTGRAVFVARQFETAAGVWSTLWRDATFGWFSRDEDWSVEAPLSRQVEFWLAAADRILAAEPTPPMMIGAARMLDLSLGPQLWLRNREFVSVFAEISKQGPSRDSDADEAALARARSRRLELAERITQLAPNSPDAWRTRVACRLAHLKTAGADAQAPPLLDLLAEAGRHDPDNALYDYLAAENLMQTSVHVEADDASEGMKLVVTDLSRFDRALAHLEAAQRKKFIRDGRDDTQAVLDYLERSRVPRYAHLHLAASRLRDGFDWPWVNLVGYQVARISGSSAAEQARVISQLLRMAEQSADDANLTDYCAWQARSMATRARRALARTNPAAEVEFVATVEPALIAARQRRLMLTSAGGGAASAAPPAATASELVYSLAVCTLFPASCLLVFVALAAWLVGWIASRRISSAGQAAPSTPSSKFVPVGATGVSPVRQYPALARCQWHRKSLAGSGTRWRFAVARHALCWLVGLTISFVLFALAPADVIGENTKRIAAYLLPTVIGIALLCGVTLFAFRRARSGWTLGLLVLGIIVLGGVAARVPNFAARLASVGPWKHVSEFGNQVPSYWLYEALPSVSVEPWVAPLVQWNYHAGLVVAVGIAVPLVGLWYFHWSGRRRQMAAGPAAGARLRGAALEIQHTSTAMAIVCIILFLLALPPLLREVEASYQAQKTWFDGLAERRGTLAASIRKMEADGASTKEFRDWAQQQIKGEWDGQR